MLAEAKNANPTLFCADSFLKEFAEIPSPLKIFSHTPLAIARKQMALSVGT